MEAKKPNASISIFARIVEIIFFCTEMQCNMYRIHPNIYIYIYLEKYFKYYSNILYNN